MDAVEGPGFAPATTAATAARLQAPTEVQTLAAKLDVGTAAIDSDDRISEKEKARLRAALHEEVESEISAWARQQLANAEQPLDQREGRARAAAAGTLAEYRPSDATRATFGLMRLMSLREAVNGAATAEAVAVVVEDAALTNDPDVIRTVLGAAVTRARMEFRGLPEHQRQGPSGVAWQTAQLRLERQLATFEAEHPSPAQELRRVAQDRERVRAQQQRDLDQWRRVLGLDVEAATRRRFPGWK
jgi:hypothetical protein